MIGRGSDGDVVTLELDQWCAGPDWLNVDPSVGAVRGQRPSALRDGPDFPGGGVQGSYSFMGCSHAGGCGDSGADGVGFTTSQDHADGPSGCFAGAGPAPRGPHWNGVGVGPEVLVLLPGGRPPPRRAALVRVGRPRSRWTLARRSCSRPTRWLPTSARAQRPAGLAGPRLGRIDCLDSLDLAGFTLSGSASVSADVLSSLRSSCRSTAPRLRCTRTRPRPARSQSRSTSTP